jgi:hypothetical protein
VVSQKMMDAIYDLKSVAYRYDDDKMDDDWCVRSSNKLFEHVTYFNLWIFLVFCDGGVKIDKTDPLDKLQHKMNLVSNYFTK